jgi:hypothetical protein
VSLCRSGLHAATAASGQASLGGLDPPSAEVTLSRRWWVDACSCPHAVRACMVLGLCWLMLAWGKGRCAWQLLCVGFGGAACAFPALTPDACAALCFSPFSLCSYTWPRRCSPRSLSQYRVIVALKRKRALECIPSCSHPLYVTGLNTHLLSVRVRLYVCMMKLSSFYTIQLPSGRIH